MGERKQRVKDAKGRTEAEGPEGFRPQSPRTVEDHPARGKQRGKLSGCAHHFSVAYGEENPARRHGALHAGQKPGFGKKSGGLVEPLLGPAEEPERQVELRHVTSQLEADPTCTHNEPSFHDVFIIRYT